MYRVAMFAAVAALAFGAFSDAQAVTINDGTVDCFECSFDQPSGNMNLQIGDRYAVSNPTFEDSGGTQFDILIEVLDRGAASDLSTGRVGTFNIRGLSRFVHYRVRTVAPGSANASNPNGTLVVVPGLDRIDILDVDSNSGQNFTDVAGVNKPIIGLGAALEQGGFQNIPDAPTQGFSYVRLDPAFTGNTETWRDEVNVPNDATHTASFFSDGGLSEFEFVWGSTGGTSGNLTRGWEVQFGVATDPPVIPLPAGLVLALTAVGALGALRRQRLAIA